MSKTPTPFTPSERHKLRDIAYRSKCGGRLSDDELRLLTKLYKQNPVEYSTVTGAARQEAVDNYRKGFGE